MTKKQLPDKIITVVEAIHNGLTKNSTFYPADKLEASVDSWTDPYKKPVIKDHNTYSGTPFGRVLSASFEKSVINTDLFTIRLHLEITDPVAIEMILDGRYQTLSIGGSTDSCVCSVCGKDILKTGYCGHWKGEMHEGKKIFWTIGIMEFDEVSFVLVPADANAQVIVPDLEAARKSRQSKDSAEGRSSKLDNILDSVDNIMEALDPKTAPATAPADPAATQEAAPADPAAAPAAVPADPAATQEADDKGTAVEKTVAEWTTEVEAEKALREAAEHRATLAEAEVLVLDGQNKTLTEANTALEARVKELDEEGQSHFKQSVALATSIKKQLAESVVDMRIALGKDKLEDRATNIIEHAKSSAKVLGTQLEALRAEKPVRGVQAAVPNPGLAGDDAHAQNEGAQVKTEPTLKEFEEIMLNALGRHNN